MFTIIKKIQQKQDRVDKEIINVKTIIYNDNDNWKEYKYLSPNSNYYFKISF